MAKNPKIKLARAWAVVEKNGRIQVDTCCKYRPDAMQCLTEYDISRGSTVRRVTVVVEMK